VGNTSSGGVTAGLQVDAAAGTLLDATAGVLLGSSGSTGDGGGGTGGGSTGGSSGGTGDSGGSGSATGASAGGGATGGLLGATVGTLLDATVGVLPDGGSTGGGTGGATDPGTGSVPGTGSDPATSDLSSSTETSLVGGLSAGVTTETLSTLAVTANPTANAGAGSAFSPENNGGSLPATPAESNGALGQGDLQPPSTAAPGVDPTPATKAAGAETTSPTGAVQNNNAPENAPVNAGAVVNPIPAPIQSQPLGAAANLYSLAEALIGEGAVGWWRDAGAGGLVVEDAASESGGVLLDASLGPEQALPGETVPLGQGEDLVSGFLPFDPQTLEAGLRRFLEQLEASGAQLANVPPSVWLLAAATLATAGEVLRRRRRRGQTDLVTAAEMRETLRWSPDLGHSEEDA
jgi:hypothetical protein